MSILESTNENSVGGGKTFKSLFSRENSFAVCGSQGQDTGGGDGELLELCSGRFTGLVSKSFSDDTTGRNGLNCGIYLGDASNAESDELLQVLSGKFGVGDVSEVEDGEELVQCTR